MHSLIGSCHCGNISYQVDTDIPLNDIIARSCECSFCQIHGAENWSDPKAKAILNIKDERYLNRYLFALKTAEFFICKQCGAYAGAVLSNQQGTWAVFNLRLVRDQQFAQQPANFDSETSSSRTQRRQQVWTATQVVVDIAAN